MEKRKTVELAITVDVANLGKELLVVGRPKPSVRLRVSGSKPALYAAEAGQIACRIDLAGLGAGVHSLPVQPADVSLPKGIKLETLLTPTINVSLAHVVRKTVGVVAMLAGTPAPGYAVIRVVLKPDRIVLRGTAEMLDGLETVRTGAIDLEGAAESFKKEVPLILPEAIQVEPSLRIVIADVQVQERIVTRVMEDIPVAGLNANGAFQIQPETITLTISGPEAIVNAVERDPAFSVAIDMTDMAPGNHLRTATIHLPVEVSLDQVSPEAFSVTIQP